MEERGWIARREFWPLALLWLPAGVAVQAAVRFLPATDGPPEPGMWVATALMGGASLVVVAPVRAAAGARLPPPLAAGLLARLLVGRRCAGREDRGGVGICRAASVPILTKVSQRACVLRFWGNDEDIGMHLAVSRGAGDAGRVGFWAEHAAEAGLAGTDRVAVG